MKTKILIIEDELNIIELIKMNLELSGYDVYSTTTGMDAIIMLKETEPDIILLDLMLPDIDGFDLCKMIRSNHQTESIPIIMVSAKSEEHNKIEGLKIGADDYVTKPFSVAELEARIEAVLRRTEKDSKSVPFKTIHHREISIYREDFLVYVNDNLLDLTPTEFKILDYLLSSKEHVINKDSIFELIGLEKNVESRTVDMHILNIRKKIEEYSDFDYIQTIRGIGYKIK